MFTLALWLSDKLSATQHPYIWRDAVFYFAVLYLPDGPKSVKFLNVLWES